jgi:hypothetical protein
MHLKKGTTFVDIGAEGGQTIADMAVAFPNGHENDTLTEILSTKSFASIIRISKLDQKNHQIVVNATKPFVITFDRAYDAKWSLNVNGKSYNPFELSPGGINGFYTRYWQLGNSSRVRPSSMVHLWCRDYYIYYH